MHYSLVKMYIVILLLLSRTVLSANILHIAPVGSHSHHIWNRALAVGLAQKGHNITLITHTEEKQKLNNIHVILLEGFYEKTYDSLSIDSHLESHANPFADIVKIYDYSLFSCEHDFSTQGFKTIMNYSNNFTFDLIIIDITLQQCYYPLIEKFNNPPVVAVTPFLLPPVLSHLFGNPLQTAYMPYYSTEHTHRMSYLERVKNFVLICSEMLYRRYIAIPAEMSLAKKHFGENIRSFHDVERNMSLLISNYDPILVYPMSLPPNIIPAGGLHVVPIKPLPNDLKAIVDNAKHGVILFTLGSYLRSADLSVEKRNEILKGFAKLPQTVLWKFESEIDNLPKNVVVRKWLPQNDILGNPKTQLFITHGGALGTQEAMYHGVPVVTIPFFTDQHANARRLVDRELGVILKYNDITTESLYSAITQVLNNPVYGKNMKELSQRFQDNPQSSLIKAVFWVEYVIRHEGAQFLDLASRDMPTYQSEGYDVILVLLIGIYLIYSLISFVLIGCKFLYTTTRS